MASQLTNNVSAVLVAGRSIYKNIVVQNISDTDVALGFNDPVVTYAAGAHQGIVLKAGQSTTLESSDTFNAGAIQVYQISAAGVDKELRVVGL